MDIFVIGNQQVTLTDDPKPALPPGSFLWIDATHDEVAADPAAWRDVVAAATGTQLYELHLIDAVNLLHPSHFDSTRDYAVVVFRKLAPNAVPSPVPAGAPAEGETGARRRIPPALTKLATQPVTFVLMERALVTVHAKGSRTIAAARSRMLEHSATRLERQTNGNGHANRLPPSPEDLMLRLLNAMVDQYLDLRPPLTAQLDRWQRALLDPRRPFKDWMALLDARIELRKLDNLCEEQHDALQELRDYLIDSSDDGEPSRTGDLLLVRVNDVMEHIARVLNHARRMEASIESAVQIHFSAMAHRTSEIVRTLTVITALFMPLTLITGIFGMNFVDMPLLKDRYGFWITMGAMAVIVVGLLFFFRRHKYLEDRVLDARR
ncbi:MAG: magnesium transporter CorA family protein [Burkholderiaceae bacterium]